MSRRRKQFTPLKRWAVRYALQARTIRLLRSRAQGSIMVDAPFAGMSMSMAQSLLAEERKRAFLMMAGRKKVQADAAAQWAKDSKKRQAEWDAEKAAQPEPSDGATAEIAAA